MKFCVQPPSLLQPRVHEIRTSRFGTQMAHPTFDENGSLAFFRMDVEAEIFFQKLGPNAIASVIDGALWYDIVHTDGLFRASSNQTPHTLVATEVRCDRAPRVVTALRIWSDDRTLLTTPFPETISQLFPCETESLGFLVGCFSHAFRQLLGDTLKDRPQDNARRTKPHDHRPFIAAPRPVTPQDPHFSPAWVVLQ